MSGEEGEGYCYGFDWVHIRFGGFCIMFHGMWSIFHDDDKVKFWGERWNLSVEGEG